jgi:hypothetical protein
MSQFNNNKTQLATYLEKSHCLAHGVVTYPQALARIPIKNHLRVGGSISILFSALVLCPKLLKLLLFNLKVNHFRELWIELADTLIQPLRGSSRLITEACKLLRYQVIQFYSSSTALPDLLFSMSAWGCTTPVAIDIYEFA